MEVAMLTALPIVIACHALQPCQTPAIVSHELVRSASPAAIVSRVQPRQTLTGDIGQSSHPAVQDVAVGMATTPSRVRRAQAPRPQAGRTTFNKAMAVFAGVIAGCYAGGYLGGAMEENGGLVGMPIGAAIGGVMVWTLVR
jgi:hypothetical protein